MRLKAGIWVSAYIRQLGGMPVPAAVVRRGDPDAGAIFIKVNMLDGYVKVLRPAAAGLDGEASGRFWTPALKEPRIEEAAADAYLARQADFDSDMWVIEIEDRLGRHFLDEFVVAE
ncbi:MULTISPECIES: DUF1491 family protein [Rhodomicrobium]|uniref:DUF1491 family protein n=1 Tax=Rhodomicrobium TaxID=1068 RepID=UPI000B4B5B36|nr:MULTISPECIES: DUF1491 family protein [Rhodomicrobium]